MSTEVTLALPDDLLERVQGWADRSGRPLNEFLIETLELSISPLGQAPGPSSKWTDEYVLATADLQLSAQIDLKLSDLLAAQREGQLSAEGQSELRRLMLLYQEHLLRKAIAVREAVKRGLREPMGL
jgi:hypothetical protein